MATVSNANMALDGGDPRLHNGVGEGLNSYTRPQMKKFYDPSVSFEEYCHYAKLTRADQDAGYTNTLSPESGSPQRAEKSEKSTTNRTAITDEEWVEASRAMRSATWLAVFYLITTDILGPYGAPSVLPTR